MSLMKDVLQEAAEVLIGINRATNKRINLPTADYPPNISCSQKRNKNECNIRKRIFVLKCAFLERNVASSYSSL